MRLAIDDLQASTYKEAESYGKRCGWPVMRKPNIAPVQYRHIDKFKKNKLNLRGQEIEEQTI